MSLFLVWIGMIFFLRNSIVKDDSKNKALIHCFTLIICFEMIGNGFCSYHRGNDINSEPEVLENTFDTWQSNQNCIIKTLSEDNSFYRVNIVGDYIINSDTYSGYNSISDFCTTENVNVRYALSSLGLATSPRVTRNF